MNSSPQPKISKSKSIKKTQVALEFILILAFVLVIMLTVMAIIGSKSIEIQELQDKKYLDDYMGTIKNELSILSQAEKGYYREVEVPTSISNYFQLDLTHKVFLVTDNETGVIYTYYFPYNGTVAFTTKIITINSNDFNYTYLTFTNR